MEALRRIRIVTLFTLQDELHHKSFYLLLIIALFFVVTLRGCFNNDVIVNGEHLDGATIGWHASMVAFQIIASMGIIIGILLSMRVLRRDLESGTTVAVLTKPFRRTEYLAGKIVGVWILSYGMTFLLHFAVYLLMLIKTGGRIPFFLPASLLLSPNILLMIGITIGFSFIVPEVVAALLGGAVWLIGFISDSVMVATKTALGKTLLEQIHNTNQHTDFWRVAWPKMSALQFFAVSLIKGQVSPVMVSYPLLNVVGYLVIAMVFIWWRFRQEEVR